MRRCVLSFTLQILPSTNNQVKIKVSDVMINVEKVGTGPHPILCLPGALGKPHLFLKFGMTSSIDTDFRPQLASLNTSKFTLVGWDPPGYGKSRPPSRDFSNGAQMFYRDAKLARALMKELKLENFSILGWSDGGTTALVMAALFPDSVRKIVIWGASAFVNEKDCEIYKRYQDVDTWSPKMRNPMIEVYGEKYFRENWLIWINTYLGIYKSGGDICRSHLEKIKCPTLIVHGRLDPMVGIEHPEYLHKHISNSKFLIMEDGKHNLHLRHFKKFNDLVEQFFSDKSK